MKAHFYWAGSIFWVTIGIYVAIHAYHLGLGRLRHPGPGFIFFWAGFLLIILGAIDLARTFLWKSKKETEKNSVWLGIRWQKITLVVVVLSAYVYSLNMFGFLLPTFLLLVFLFKAIEPTKWWIAITGSFITTLASYEIFKVWLKVPFPKGFLGF